MHIYFIYSFQICTTGCLQTFRCIYLLILHITAKKKILFWYISQQSTNNSPLNKLLQSSCIQLVMAALSNCFLMLYLAIATDLHVSTRLRRMLYFWHKAALAKACC